MKTIEAKERLGQILKQDRESVSMSRESVAAKTTISASTIKNWENGYSAPDIIELFEFYDALGLNPQKTIDAIRYPAMDGLTGKNSDEEVESAFDKMFKELSITEKRHLLFMRSSYHGSDWMAILQLITAHLHTPIAARYAVALLVSTHYKLSAATNTLNCMDNILPNMELLDKAIERGKKAAYFGQNGYQIHGDLK